MQEQRRFAIALGGVGGCLAIAAGIVLTGPGDVTPPPVAGVPVALADRLPRVPLPSWSDIAITPRRARATGSARVAPRQSREAVAVAHTASAEIALASAPPHIDEPGPLPSSVVSRQATMPVVMSNVPAPDDTTVARQPARERGPVTGAFVTAGTHVGGGFKTVGRTLRRVF